MEVITIETESFYQLIDQVVKRIKEKQGIKEDRWISPAEAMKKLRITSKTTLQKLRDEGKIKYSQPTKKIVLYHAQSIDEFLQANSYEIF